MLPFSLIYSDGFYLDMGPHVFPGEKYSLVHARLLESKDASPQDFFEPTPISTADLLRVHEPDYIDRLLNGTLHRSEIQRMELGYSKKLVDATLLGCGGTLLGGRLALRDGIACCLGGGFHHAYPDHGEGFCILHDVAVAIRCLQADLSIKSALVIDLDVHQGNGTAAIFPPQNRTVTVERPSQNAVITGPYLPSADGVFTVSLHQFNNYPQFKPQSSVDVHLEDGTPDADYLAALDRTMSIAIAHHRPDLVVYIAGADPYLNDQLGGLALTIAGLRERDRHVFRFAQTNQLPIVSVYAGGYARDVNDTVTIHTNTVLAAAEVFHFHGATSF